MKIKLMALALIALTYLNGRNSMAQKSRTRALYSGIEFSMPQVQEPRIPNNTVNIKDFGAISGGDFLNTQAIAEAIDAVSKKGGGKVIIPAGIWLTGPIILKSNIELHASSGALIRFSTDKDLYPLIETSFEGLDTWRCLSPIYGKNIENIAFTGSGIWDGSGEAWRMVKKSKLTESEWKKLVASGGVVDQKNGYWYPSEQFKVGANGADQNVRFDLTTKEEFQAIRDFLRPVMVSIQNAKRVKFDGPVFQNSPAWCLHPFMIEDLIVRNITVRNPWYSQNGDGLDVESCKNVIIENSSFDVGDDAICIKSGKDQDGRDRGVACENLIIKNNVVYHGHGGVTVGSEMSGGVKNMHVSHNTFIGTDVGLRFKSTRGRGGVVENIYISDIYMVNIPSQAISFNLYYGGKSAAEVMAEGGDKQRSTPMAVTEETPQFKNISIKNIEIKGAHQAVLLQGLPEMNLENIELSNLTIDADQGLDIVDVSGLTINNMSIRTKSPQVLEIYNSKEININNLKHYSTAKNAFTIGGPESKKILIKGTSQAGQQTSFAEDLPKDSVQFQ
ncbi:glycoside hydrolase family 28 protein [Dyadobacter tibetensis]|uniref:glycoside hydrolase family 28 protein n=1 Tax=Dyadobacter tibetensis TaxID=1211851 RepID=UPI000471BF88|nr:glycoside hydrolase family 28 protein [Dyadobacter tibetensis]